MQFRKRSNANKDQEKSFTKPGEPVAWVNIIMYLVLIPSLSIYGLFTTKITKSVIILTFIWYFLTGMSITGGYHRLWTHRAYKASNPLQLCFMIFASATMQDSIYQWATDHRMHHKYTDTDLDPYNIKRGFVFAHSLWLAHSQSSKKSAKLIHVKDLENNPIVMWQHRNFWWFGIFMWLIFPSLLTLILLNDIRSGFFIVGATTTFIVQQSTALINSLSHSNFFGLQSQTYEDGSSAYTSPISALFALGEGYHNFHHAFPNDYRNGIKWYHYDPTKWFIYLCKIVGLAYDLNITNKNETDKAELYMKEKTLLMQKQNIDYGVKINELPVWTKKQFAEKIRLKENNNKTYIIFYDIVHDVTKFIDNHPGGSQMITARNGKDVTKQMNGVVYNHSNGARNLMAYYRVARIKQ